MSHPFSLGGTTPCIWMYIVGLLCLLFIPFFSDPTPPSYLTQPLTIIFNLEVNEMRFVSVYWYFKSF